jgi:hypothetical protein
MSQRIIRCTFTLSAVFLTSAIIALAQSPTSIEIGPVPVGNTPTSNSWQVAQQVGSSTGRLFVVTLDQPHRRQACRVKSFTVDKLVCFRALGGSRTYLPPQVAALILPGDGHLRLWLVLGFNAGLGAAIWGTVVFAAVCPGCAVATGIAALCLFLAAADVLIGDDQPDRLLYLAPGEKLSRKLGYVESR